MSTFEAAGAPEQAWKVGALARAAGLTVRTLHYYDQIDQPYGIREYGARDPEGQLWYFHSPLG